MLKGLGARVTDIEEMLNRKRAPMAITTEPQQLLQLLAFMSPAFPVGGFAYSAWAGTGH